MTTSPVLSWENTQSTIDTDNLKFKANNLVYSPLYNWTINTKVTLWNWISIEEYSTAKWSDASSNILEYVVRTADTNDFMCSEVWTYSDNTSIQLEVPAWQAQDTYQWTLWITLQQS